MIKISHTMTKPSIWFMPLTKTQISLHIFCFDCGLTSREQFFSHVETEPPFPGYYQYFWGVNVSCSRKQHTDPAEDRTRVSRSRVNALTTRPVRPQLAHLSSPIRVFTNCITNDLSFPRMNSNNFSIMLTCLCNVHPLTPHLY